MLPIMDEHDMQRIIDEACISYGIILTDNNEDEQKTVLQIAELSRCRGEEDGELILGLPEG